MDHKWDKWFLGMAEYVSTASKDPSTKVGAVIIDSDRTVVSLGYNGFPRGIEDDPEKLNNRDIKLEYIVHAERNSLLFAKQSLKDCIIYTYPFMPCPVCAGMIIQAGIKRVVSYYVPETRWYDEFVISTKMFHEAGINVILYLDKELDYYKQGYYDK
jgi:dCMP deaminase